MSAMMLAMQCYVLFLVYAVGCPNTYWESYNKRNLHDLELGVDQYIFIMANTGIYHDEFGRDRNLDLREQLCLLYDTIVNKSAG